MAAPDHDPFLGAMLATVEGSQFIADVTLWTHGLVVSGTPISTRQYFEETGQLMGQAVEHTEPRVGDAFRDTFARLGQLSEPAHNQPQSDDQATRDTPAFVHLRDVTIYSAGLGEMRIPLWRGRLSEVAGWAFGRIGAPEAADDADDEDQDDIGE